MSVVLRKLALQPLPLHDVKLVRNRLILCWRLLGLYRSIDLAQAFRQISWIDDRPFILVKRKGWKQPRWEEVLVLDNKFISPWHLLQTYVSLTHHLPPGSLLLRALQAPFAPLSSDRVASITKQLLQDLGVPMSMWGPHSTRGAGVQFFKHLGMSSDQVCELGQWKNFEAFQKHYLRVGAHQEARLRVQNFVHKVSHSTQAEPERSQTPPRRAEGGGSDLEGEAKVQCETCFPVPAVLFRLGKSLVPSRP